MKRFPFFVIAGSVAGALALGGCNKNSDEGAEGEGEAAEEAPDLRTQAGATFGVIEEVEVNAEMAALGARLYHDTNLSGDGTLSCASCHSVADGGDDGAVSSTGINGQLGPINSPTTLNSHLNFVQFWDGRAEDLAAQAAGPIANPIEMGFTLESAVSYLQSEQSYVEQFGSVFEGGEINVDTLTAAIAEYEKTLTTPNSPFDQWLAGDDEAMSEDAIAGLELFMEVGCQTCHMGAGFGGTSYQMMGAVHNYFEMRGGELTEADMGRFNVTGDEADRHKFKVPLLRNVELTAPYFHDGSAETLEEAVTTMAYVQLNRELEEEDVAKLVAFLESLTGDIPEVDLAALALPPVRTPEPEVVEGDGEGAPEVVEDEGESATQK